eukprot:1183678-Prorocentrum_minimum.AAC.1
MKGMHSRSASNTVDAELSSVSGMADLLTVLLLWRVLTGFIREGSTRWICDAIQRTACDDCTLLSSHRISGEREPSLSLRSGGVPSGDASGAESL